MKRIAITSTGRPFLAPPSAFCQTRSRSSSEAQAHSWRNIAAARRRVHRRDARRRSGQEFARFTYLLGGIASSIAAVDEAARRNEASPAVVQQNQESKTRLGRVFKLSGGPG